MIVSELAEQAASCSERTAGRRASGGAAVEPPRPFLAAAVALAALAPGEALRPVAARGGAALRPAPALQLAALGVEHATWVGAHSRIAPSSRNDTTFAAALVVVGEGAVADAAALHASRSSRSCRSAQLKCLAGPSRSQRPAPTLATPSQQRPAQALPCAKHDAGGGAPAAAARAGPDDGAKPAMQKPLRRSLLPLLAAAAVSTPPMQEKPRAAFLTPSRYEPYAGDAYAPWTSLAAAPSPRHENALPRRRRARGDEDGGPLAAAHGVPAEDGAPRGAHAAAPRRAPHIVALREVIECERSIHIVLELVDGCTVAGLCGRAADGRLSTADAATIAAQALAALAHCHAHRVCHRDVKADNLLVDPARLDGSVKLIDFGIAAVWREDGAPLTRADGATAYMAPERVRGGRTKAPGRRVGARRRRRHDAHRRAALPGRLRGRAPRQHPGRPPQPRPARPFVAELPQLSGQAPRARAVGAVSAPPRRGTRGCSTRP